MSEYFQKLSDIYPQIQGQQNPSKNITVKTAENQR